VSFFALAAALAAQVRPPSAPKTPPGIIDRKPIIDPIPWAEQPATIVNGDLVEGVQRDSVLRALRGKQIDSIVVWPAGAAAQARFGSRAAGGLVLISAH
jgi:hypothetical protein